jgi:hypothetical protein
MQEIESGTVVNLKSGMTVKFILTLIMPRSATSIEWRIEDHRLLISTALSRERGDPENGDRTCGISLRYSQFVCAPNISLNRSVQDHTRYFMWFVHPGNWSPGRPSETKLRKLYIQRLRSGIIEHDQSSRNRAIQQWKSRSGPLSIVANYFRDRCILYSMILQTGQYIIWDRSVQIIICITTCFQ